MLYGVNVNWVVVFVASVVSFIVGFIWYGPLFGKQWLKFNKMKAPKKPEGMGGKMLIAFVSTIITSYVLAVLISLLGLTGVFAGAKLGFFVWLGFLATTTLIGGVLWKNEPWGLFVLNGAYWLVNLKIIGAILGYWA